MAISELETPTPDHAEAFGGTEPIATKDSGSSYLTGIEYFILGARLASVLYNLVSLKGPRIMTDHSTSASEVSTFFVPFAPFREFNPKLWFVQIEATLALRNVTSELNKFHHVVAILPPNVLDEVYDVVRSNEPNPYLRIKEAIIRRFGLTAKQRLEKLLSYTELGEKKPSQLLRQMQQLIDEDEDEDSFLKEIWLSRLPVNVQAMLCVSTEVKLNALAEVADRIMESSLAKFKGDLASCSLKLHQAMVP
ncbi:unnamed protein product [Echinostoma caproni]|uniref:CDT1 domain-containing protein n=1 Tax=Echinostoma caproni TaxID=27848 RepID=A0A183AMV9_9TREM|nr:unnamed protein product [Echinostoma caproni]